MNRRLVITIGLVCQFCFCLETLWAQPTVQRVEERLRKQSASRAGDPPGENVQTAGKSDSPGYLGILADDRDEKGKGVRITEVMASGPSAKAGLKVGDLITTIDGKAIEKVDDMIGALQGRPAGAEVKFAIQRDGDNREIVVRLEKRPAPAERRLPAFGKQPEDMPSPATDSATDGGGPAPATNDSILLNSRRPKLGVKTVSITPHIREQMRLPGSYVAGVYVTYVDRDAPAGKAGLPVNCVITAVDGEPMDSPDTLAALVHRAGPGQTMNVTYYYRDHESVAVVTLAGGPARASDSTGQAQPTVRARPPVPMDQPPGFAPDVSDEAATTIAELQSRVAALEKRVAELEAAMAKQPAAEPADPGDDQYDSDK